MREARHAGIAVAPNATAASGTAVSPNTSGSLAPAPSGHPSALAWCFDFNNGFRNDDDAGRFANCGRRASCVRRSGE
jgi:hypothetical protein